jgi:ABC transporter DrrB family efflux protein
LTTSLAASVGRHLALTISDTLVMARRNLLRYVRLPQLLAVATIQPVMFILLFAYVFGGAIDVGNTDYIDFLLPGILVQTVVFGSIQTGVGLADDLSKGMIDRFRSLPMARSAVLGGRILADMVRNTFVVMLMVGVGSIIGFRFHEGAIEASAALILAVLFGMTFSWISALIGILVKEVETVQVAGFILIFPMVFISSVFVPVESMPGWLQPAAKISPVTVTVDTIRGLSLGGAVSTDFWKSIAWMSGLLAIFVPLAVYRYRHTS